MPETPIESDEARSDRPVSPYGPSPTTAVGAAPAPAPTPAPAPAPEYGAAASVSPYGAAPASTHPPAAPPVGSRDPFGLAALVVGLVAVVTAVIPAAVVVAWLPALVAVGLGIAALASKGVTRKGHGLAGLILGVVAFLLAIVVSVAALFWSASAPIGGSTGDFSSGLLDEALNDPDAADEYVPSEFQVVGGTATGDLDDPFPIGETVEVTNHGEPYYSITVGAPNPDADALVAEENPYNDVAPEGSSYVLVPVTVEFHGDAEDPDALGSPAFDIRVSFTTGDGGRIDEDYAVIPDPFFMLPELKSGESATGNLVFVLPDSTLDAGTWLVDLGYEDSFHTSAR
ncbi:DUF4190 domain-containing protein [Agromyces allii]|uniref:DUF4190 domain-containing protein n=1 Tax=Agromyces allii TaxID=393607 RepID=A0ABP5BKB7_9MICO|nr:DUF4190 domain-containing protein [Agromyces allii]